MRSPTRLLALPFLLSLAIAVGACQASGPTPAPSGPPAPAASGAPSEAPEATVDRTPVPGYEDWQTINPQAVRISTDGDALVLELIGSKLWFNTERGVLFGEERSGDFRATATVRTARTSDPSLPPGGDGSIQLAGLMAHADGPIENYVFVVAGSIGSSTGVESKTTTRGASVYVQRGPVAEGDAELRLCRRGEEFTTWWRPAGSTADWTHMSTFQRPDLPDALQVGVNIYTDGVPDITARFEGLAIEPLEDGEDC
jgi:hypothetical protein